VDEGTEEEGSSILGSDEFLARLTHELRSPLSPILTWVEVLRDESLDPPARVAAAAAIERSARSLQSMIEDIAVAVRSSPSSLALGRERLDFAALVRDIATWFAGEAERKGIALHASCRDVLPVSGDPKRLRQIVRNLVENALKFTPQGGRVTIVADRIGDAARLRISDSGRGLPAGEIGRVFDGVQRRGVPLQRDRGIGLGLAAVRCLVELHDGSITVESAGRGRGSAFTVELPLEPVGPEALVDPVSERPELRGLRVLVVDDEPDVALAVSTLLTRWGVEAQAVQSAADALGVLAHQPFDVMVSDIAMPRHDGYALMVAIRETESRLGARRLRSVALTAHSRELERRKAVEAGFDAIVAKPIEAEELRQTLCAVLALHA